MDYEKSFKVWFSHATTDDVLGILGERILAPTPEQEFVFKNVPIFYLFDDICESLGYSKEDLLEKIKNAYIRSSN